MVIAMERVVRGFAMPGTGIPDFRSRARTMATAGVYDFAIHHDQILVPIVMQRFGLLGLTGLSPEAEQARDSLVAYIDRVSKVARRAEARKPVLVAGGSD
jgi:acyl-[acyl-carrier-protein] desaturase